jgi:hypothetical protein
MHGPGDHKGYPDAQCLEKMSLYKLAQTGYEKRE